MSSRFGKRGTSPRQPTSSILVSVAVALGQLVVAVLMAGAYALAGVLPLTLAFVAVVRPMNLQGPVGIVLSVPLGVLVGLFYFVVSQFAGSKTYRTVLLAACAGLVLLSVCSLLIGIPMVRRIGWF